MALADVTDPAEVPAAIAHGIGLFDGPERPAADALFPYVAGRSMVIVLDNLEQVLEAAGHVHVDRSGVAGHARDRHEPGAPARRRRARAGGPPVGRRRRPACSSSVRGPSGRAGNPSPTGPIIEEICALLDDLPLGIELAAARIALLPPAVIRDRLAVTPAPARTRRRATRPTVSARSTWRSPGVTTCSTRRSSGLLHELAVFEGGFDLEQVDAMSLAGGGATDRLDDLLELADRSLIVAVPEVTGRARFRMLRTIQTFALARLAEDDDEAAARRRHAEAFLELVRTEQTRLNTSWHGVILDRVGPEMANIRAAVRWAIDAEAGELALGLVANLWRFWNAFGLGTEGRRLTETVLAMPSAAGVSIARSWAASAAGSLAYWQADTAGARAWYEEQIELAKATGDEAGVVDGLFNLGHVAFPFGTDEAVQRRFAEEVIQRYRDLGDARSEARAAWALAILAMGAGRADEATDLLERALPEFERLDDRQYHAMTVSSLGWAWFTRGDIPLAIRYAIDGLLESHAMRDIATTTISLHVGVLVAAVVGRFEDAAELIGTFDASCERYGVRPPVALSSFIKTHDPFAATAEALPPEAYAAAYERGRRLSLDEAVAKVADLGEAAAAAAAGPAIADA